MTYGEGPKTRRKDHLKSARSALDRWRINTYLNLYGDTSLTPEVLLPDKFLSTLGSKRAKTLQELRDLVPHWAFADEHISDVMRTLSRVDEQERVQRQCEKELRAADRAEKRQAKRAAENLNLQPPKKRGRPPRARAPLAIAYANTVVCYTLIFSTALTLFPMYSPRRQHLLHLLFHKLQRPVPRQLSHHPTVHSFHTLRIRQSRILFTFHRLHLTALLINITFRHNLTPHSTLIRLPHKFIPVIIDTCIHHHLYHNSRLITIIQINSHHPSH